MCYVVLCCVVASFVVLNCIILSCVVLFSLVSYDVVIHWCFLKAAGLALPRVSVLCCVVLDMLIQIP